MKTAFPAKNWLERLRSASASPRSSGAEKGPGTAPLHEAMGLIAKGDLIGATKSITQNLAQLRTMPDAAPNDVIEGSYTEVSDAGTFSHYERPLYRQNSAARAATGQFQEATYTNAAGSRRYKLFIPSTYCGQPMPLVVMLHGCKQTPDDFALGTRMNALGEAQQCFVVYPGQSKGANGAKCWNWFNAYDQRRGYGEPAIIAGLTRELVKKFGLDSTRVYVAGLSAGAAMAVVMGRTYPDLYAAVGVHSGLAYAAAHDVPSAFAAMKGSAPVNSGARASSHVMPTIVFYGDADTTVHPGNGERVTAESAAHAAAAFDANSTASPAIEDERGRVPGGHAYTRKLYRNAEGIVTVEQWIVHGAGHAWFGGNARGSYTDPKGPDASAAMMRFFTAHALIKQPATQKR